MRVYSLILAILTAAVLVGAVTAAHAGLVSEDVAYWYTVDGGAVGTIFNPSSEWLSENLSSLLIKVQQTVYDASATQQILSWSGISAPDGGCLFAYSVTNLGWYEGAIDGGLTTFAVNWGFEPMLVTKDPYQTPASWTPGYVNDGVINGPSWSVSGQAPGIRPGSTVGGFWAIAPISEDGIVAAGAKAGVGDSGWLIGETTGPMVPEPASMVALAGGLIGLAIGKRRTS